MARIIFSDGKELQDLPAVQSRLARLGITLRHWPAPAEARARELMDKKSLNDAEKEELLGFVQNRFEELKREMGYQTRDMVVIHEDIPGLADMLGKFDKIHTHSDDEVRYILAGTGYFDPITPIVHDTAVVIAETEIDLRASRYHCYIRCRDVQAQSAIIGAQLVDSTPAVQAPLHSRRRVQTNAQALTRGDMPDRRLFAPVPPRRLRPLVLVAFPYRHRPVNGRTQGA